MNFQRTIKTVTCSLIAFATFVAQPLSAYAFGEFTVYPSYTHQGNSNWIIHQAESNSTIRDFITLENLSTEPITLNLHFTEGSITDNNFSTFSIKQDQEKTDLGKWFHTDSQSITLSPQSKQKLPFSITIPEKVNAQTYAGVIYASHTNNSENSLPITTQIGIRTYISVNTPLPAPLENKQSPSQPWLLYGLAIIFMASIITILFQNNPKKRKFSHSLLLILIIAFGFFSLPTQAQIMEVEITKGGYLLKGPTNINFPRIEASFEEVISEVQFRNLEENGFIEIEDLNGGTPFSLSVSASDFVSGTHTIPNHNIFVRNQDNQDTAIQAIQGNTTNIELNPSTDTYAPLSETQTLLDRTDGEEPGKWRIFPSFQLRIPENTKAGTYTTNIVFTII